MLDRQAGDFPARAFFLRAVLFLLRNGAVIASRGPVADGAHYFFVAILQHPWPTTFEHARLAAMRFRSGPSSWHDPDVPGVRDGRLGHLRDHRPLRERHEQDFRVVSYKLRLICTSSSLASPVLSAAAWRSMLSRRALSIRRGPVAKPDREHRTPPRKDRT